MKISFNSGDFTFPFQNFTLPIRKTKVMYINNGVNIRPVDFPFSFYNSRKVFHTFSYSGEIVGYLISEINHMKKKHQIIFPFSLKSIQSHSIAVTIQICLGLKEARGPCELPFEKTTPGGSYS